MNKQTNHDDLVSEINNALACLYKGTSKVCDNVFNLILDEDISLDCLTKIEEFKEEFIKSMIDTKIKIDNLIKIKED